jgi:GTPase SAR1 family protein
MDVIAAVLGVVAAIITGVITWNMGRSDLAQRNNLLSAQLDDGLQKTRKLESQVADLSRRQAADADNIAAQEAKIAELTATSGKYDALRDNLRRSHVVQNYAQPVILIGPRFVGKTSLLEQLRAPWNHDDLMTTSGHHVAEIPFYDFKQRALAPHFADPTIMTDVHAHLKLRVHDFPGELNAQPLVVQEAAKESAALRERTGLSLGLVLICMFDAIDAHRGISSETRSYYNGELFRTLVTSVSRRTIEIDRIIIVFNKYDLLSLEYPGTSDTELLMKCIKSHRDHIDRIRDICHSDKICEVLTVLTRGAAMSMSVRGAPIVLGEAARIFVSKMAEPAAVDRLIPESATTLVSQIANGRYESSGIAF